MSFYVFASFVSFGSVWLTCVKSKLINKRYPFENGEWRDGVYVSYDRRRLQRESRSASARERRDEIRTVDLERWGGREPASSQLNTTNMLNKVKGRNGGRSSKKKKMKIKIKLQQQQSQQQQSQAQTSLLRSRRPKSASSDVALGTSSRIRSSNSSSNVFKKTQPMTASMFKHRPRSASAIPKSGFPAGSGPRSGPGTGADSPSRRSRTNDAVDAALRRSMGLGKKDDLLNALLAANSTPTTPCTSPDRSTRFSHNVYSRGALDTSPSRSLSIGPRMTAPA